MPQQEESKNETQHGDDEDFDEKLKRMIQAKIISTTHGHIISVLNITINQRPFIVNRVFRFHEFENTIAKRRLQLVGKLKTVQVGKTNVEMKFVHCVEHTFDATPSNRGAEMSRVVVEWGSDHYNGDELTHVLNLLIRYRCMEANGMGMFYLLIYNDPYQSGLCEVS